MRLIFAFIAASILMIGPAHADPITAIITAITSVVSSIGSAIGAVGASIFGATAWGTISGFLASPFGSLLLGVGLSLVSTLFVAKQKRSQSAPSIEAGKVNVRIVEPERWICAGRVRQGGGALFGEFDPNGNFWFIIAHADSPLIELEKIYFDDIEIFTESGQVLAPEFCLDPDFNSYSGVGTKVPYWLYYNHTFTENNPVPTFAAELAAYFPAYWTTDHKLVGVTYSVICGNPLPVEHRYKIYKWRGAFGLGEPGVSVVGLWSRVYDPRDPTQNINNKDTWKPSTNSALIWAWFRTHPRGRQKAMSEINWTRVAEQADICDEMVTGIEGTQKRYECGIAIPDSKERSAAEQEIMLSCDGQLVFDDDGKCWMRVGYYEAPSLHLTRNRDIIGMESVEAQNGESETQGVIVRYLSPQANYSAQPAAAWINPNYYVAGQVTKFLQVDILTIQNHNQAMRVAKAMGMRSQPLHKLLPTTGLRGLRARQERIIDLNYDNTFAGDYEIVTPVEVDQTGIFCGMGLVPVDADRWTLLPGEEKPAPVIADIDTAYVIEPPTGVTVVFQNGRFEATFDDPRRSDWRVRFQYSPAGGSQWSDFVVQMENNFAYTGGIAPNADWDIRWQTVTASARVSAWVTGPVINTSPLVLSGTPVTTVIRDTTYPAWTIGVTGGILPYTFFDELTRLPPGITIDPGTGEVSGTPDTAGLYTDIKIKVVDSIGNFKYFPLFNIEVTNP